MAKLVITYEDEKIKHELTFGGEVYAYTMLPTEGGKTSDVPAFDTQIERKYPEIGDEVLGEIERLSFGDDSDIEEVLELLTELEDELGSLNESITLD